MNKPQAGARVLKPFIFATEDDRAKYGAFVRSCCAQPPFKAGWIPESLNTEKRFDTLRALYFVTRGRPGSHAKLHEHAAVLARIASEELSTTTFPSMPS